MNGKMSNISTKPNVYVTRRVPSAGVKLLEQYCQVTQWLHDEVVPRDELLKAVKGIDGLFCLLTDKIDKQLLSAAGKETIKLLIIFLVQ